MNRGKIPYKKLGQKLYQIRLSHKESLVEVSGAVELNSDIITSYEKGETRPSEDVLDLLISHFEIQDDEAEELYELAGYIEDEPVSTAPSLPDLQNAVPTMIVVPADSRTAYTDKVSVTVNNYGVVMNFMQSMSGGQHLPVARLGMSLEHAKSVVSVLQKTISQAEQEKRPKQIKPSEENKSDNKN